MDHSEQTPLMRPPSFSEFHGVGSISRCGPEYITRFRLRRLPASADGSAAYPVITCGAVRSKRIPTRMVHHTQRPMALEPRIRAGAAERARRIKLVLMDVDGVLTDGRIVFAGPDASETKHFDAQDGVGIRIAQRAGLLMGLITGRASEAVRRRARELGIAEVHLNSFRKADAWERILAARRLRDADAAFIGDDIVDMPVLVRAGFAATVPNARPEVLRAAHFVTSRPGGSGAVREVLDFILKVQGRWESATRGFLE